MKTLLTNLLLCLCLCAHAQTNEDKTSLIANPNFESGTTGWETENLQLQTNNSFAPKNGSTYMERWVNRGNKVGNASARQTVSGLSTGTYKLTVAAQNLNEGASSQKCTGAYVYADDQRTPIYTPGDYSVTFTCLTGTAEIGFFAENATGNWLALDNFRLTLVEKIDAGVVAQEVNNLVKKAEELLPSIKHDGIAHDLENAINAGKLITEASPEENMQAALLNLRTMFDKAQFAFNIDNATPGSGVAPAVTKTNTYVATGATQALVRASIKGSNILESGVCWSTRHDPTVLDERTTKSFSLNGTIYHIKGLQPSTVYYARPYVINKTYTVAYGDELKIVTHPTGTCTGSWDEKAPDEAANKRCREAIQQTIEYFNEWTGIQGFHLSGHYGADTPTADCSYGGWMRIGPNPAYQAIGTVLHETGHGVGVGTSARWNNCTDTREREGKYGKWLGREANTVLQFLENKYNNETYFLGDAVHGWGNNASYDWLVNGADKDKHSELQYIGGMCILHGLFVDGLCPTSATPNGIAAYSYNFDDNKKYYLMNKDKAFGLGEGLLYQRSGTGVAWKSLLNGEVVSDSAAWNMEFDPKLGMYLFKNAATGKYLTHSANGEIAVRTIRTQASEKERFQLMPDRTNVTFNLADKKTTTHGFWFTWEEGGSKAMTAQALSASRGYGAVAGTVFNFSDKATNQQWIILSEDELKAYQDKALVATDLYSVPSVTDGTNEIVGIYNVDGTRLSHIQRGFNVLKYKDGTSKKTLVR